MCLCYIHRFCSFSSKRKKKTIHDCCACFLLLSFFSLVISWLLFFFFFVCLLFWLYWGWLRTHRSFVFCFLANYFIYSFTLFCYSIKLCVLTSFLNVFFPFISLNKMTKKNREFSWFDSTDMKDHVSNKSDFDCQ
jgi:predicted membrane protein